MQVDGPWTSWKLTNMKGVASLYRTTLQLLQLSLPGTPLVVAGQETGDVRGPGTHSAQHACVSRPGEGRARARDFIFAILRTGHMSL